MNDRLFQHQINSSFVMDFENNGSNSFANDTTIAGNGDEPLSLRVLEWFNTYYLGAIIVLGVFGNANNFFMFMQTQTNKLSSPSYYLASLALTDVIFLAVLFILWLDQFGIDLFNRVGFCQTFVYLNSTSSCISVWLTVAFTFERLIVVRYPLKRPAMCTIGRTKLIISCLSMVTLVVQAYSLITTGVTENMAKGADVGVGGGGNGSTEISQTVERRCGLYPDYYQAMRVINTLDTIITLIIPIVLIVSMNTLICHSLFNSSRSFEKDEDKHQYPSTSSVKSNRSYEAEGNKPLQQQQSPTSLPTKNEIQVTEDHHLQIQRLSDTAIPTNNAHQLSSSPCDILDSALAPEIPVIAAVGNNDELPSSIAISDLSNHTCVNITEHVDDTDKFQSGNYIEEEVRDASSDKSVEVRLNKNGFRLQQSVSVDSQQEPAVAAEPAIDRRRSRPYTITTREGNNGNNKRSSRKSNSSTNSGNHRVEFIITKKLILISTVHILLNLPSYLIRLKVFINEETTTGTEETSLTTWILQQYSMLLYYTHFSINFLLYSTSSATLRHQQLFCIFWCKKKSAQSVVVN